jgi:hypothetical protein
VDAPKTNPDIPNSKIPVNLTNIITISAKADSKIPKAYKEEALNLFIINPLSTDVANTPAYMQSW